MSGVGASRRRLRFHREITRLRLTYVRGIVRIRLMGDDDAREFGGPAFCGKCRAVYRADDGAEHAARNFFYLLYAAVWVIGIARAGFSRTQRRQVLIEPC